MTKTTGHILVVDDDPDIGLMIKAILEFNGYSVVVTERPEKVKALVRSDSFNLLIMDMLLSGMNGIDICAGLKNDASISPLAIIMISAHPNAKEICHEAGADDFVSKPFDIEEMLSKVHRLVHPYS